jgi:hypothetical protein
MYIYIQIVSVCDAGESSVQVRVSRVSPDMSPWRPLNRAGVLECPYGSSVSDVATYVVTGCMHAC